jgi:hypothetical protein
MEGTSEPSALARVAGPTQDLEALGKILFYQPSVEGTAPCGSNCQPVALAVTCHVIYG